MTNPRRIEPLTTPPDVTVEVPGSKSLTNRALVAAALAAGPSRLEGILLADDTEAMIAGLSAIGIEVRVDAEAVLAEVEGCDGRVPAGPATVDVRLSGTTARFVAPMLALGHGDYTLDAATPFRSRPMEPLLDGLRALGVEVIALGDPGRLPVRIRAGRPGLAGGRVAVSGDVSSQFLSGLLLAGPAMRNGLEVTLSTPLVSAPYVDLTVSAMTAFGARVDRPAEDRFTVAPTGYRGTHYLVEPDASAASYLLAAAAITGGRVRVDRLTRRSAQGDIAFADVLGRMGAEVVADDGGIEVRGHGGLHGVDVDLGDLSDTAQTLAAVAVFADGPTRVRGIGFIRRKETDRIRATVTELRRCGIVAREEPDGFVIEPGTPTPAVIRTYDDHRMAMSFALIGLVVPGIAIADPGCVAKTFPAYFDVLERLREPGPRPRR